MKVRTKFTIWIALVSSFSAFLFSIFMYSEMIEEPQKLIKRELLDTADSIAAEIPAQYPLSFSPASSSYPLQRYFIKVLTESGEMLYSSPLASQVDIPRQPVDGFTSLTRRLAPQHVWLDPLEDDTFEEIKSDQVQFHLVQISADKAGERVTVMVGKPLAMLSAELTELLHEMLLFIILTTIIIVLLSYLLAGRLLEPIGRINARITAIRESSLNERIPLGKSEDELYALTLSLNSMFDRLENSFGKQKEFIGNAAHEMKIPLTIALLGHEELLGRNLPDELRIEINRQLINLYRLNKLVKDLLDISNLEHRENIDRHSIGLPLLIEKVLEDFDEMLQAAAITCTTKIERINISGDYDKLIRVFINLIDNAIKYNRTRDGHIVISAEKDGDIARIAIENSGRTIPAQDLPHIFEQFYRVEKSRASQYGGTGLGLTIVKRIIELHGGSISAACLEGKTTFSFTLPLA